MTLGGGLGSLGHMTLGGEGGGLGSLGPGTYIYTIIAVRALWGFGASGLGSFGALGLCALTTVPKSIKRYRNRPKLAKILSKSTKIHLNLTKIE